MTIDFLKKKFVFWTNLIWSNFLFALVLCHKLCLNIFARFGIFIFTLIFGKTFSIKTRNLIKYLNYGKQTNLKLDRVIFSANKSFLFKKSIIDVLTNHLLLQIESNKRRDSCIRLVVSSSTRTFSKIKQKWLIK
jgi:hypothetical protein